MLSGKLFRRGSIEKRARVAVDPISEDNPIEEILLTGFPNPERKGCPPPEVIEALGNRQPGRDHQAWQHIWGCSPCFRDFKAIRDARLAKIERAAKSKRTRRNFIAAAVASAFAGVGGYFLVSNQRSKPVRSFAVVPIDLTNAGTLRGTTSDEVPPLAQLPRRLDEIHLTLPRFSPVGHYVVAILRSTSENTAIALSSANATGTEAQVTLIVTLDLSEAKPGRYFLGTRLEEQGQQGTPNYYPVLISH
jgi:hypothetical protein